MTPSPVPSTVDTSSLEAGARVMFASGGSAAMHNLAVVARPPLGLTTGKIWQQGMVPNDSDHDGMTDLVEYAFGLTGSNSGSQLPQARKIGDNYVVQFTQPAGVTGITYGAEWSTTLLPGSWTDIPDTGSGSEHLFSVPADAAPSLFMRLKVTGQ